MNVQKTNTQTELLEEIRQDAKPAVNFDNTVNFDNEIRGQELESYIRREIRKQELRGYRLDNDEKERTIAWKQENMSKVYWLCIACLVCLLSIVVLDGIRPDGFILSPGVMIAIISGTVVNVLGLYAIVLYNLFPKGRKR